MSNPYKHFHGGHLGGHRSIWHRRGRRWQRLYPGAPAAPDPKVQFAQSCLAQSDPSVPQDGVMGPQTRQAIQAFQSQHQLPPSGTLDSDTMAALQAACSGQSGDQPGPPSPQQGGGRPPRPSPPQHEGEEGEFPFGGIFSQSLFDRHRDDRFREDRNRWHGDRDQRRPWFAREIGTGEGEEGEFRFERPFSRPLFDFRRDDRFREDRWRADHGESEIRPERPFVRTGFVRPAVEFRPIERPLDRGRWNWDRDRRGFPARWEGRDWAYGVPGDRTQILWAQSCLAQILGPWVLQDGAMGKNTEGAIRAFQEQRQLPVTGVLDGNTVNALQAACGS
jgi:peptidoglycan hydrolase-like protein with peptidoglycan-binding domain